MADLGGAGLHGTGVSSEFASTHGGVFGPLAMAQYGAMARLRWEIFRSGLRSIHGVFDLGATGITWMIYGVLGLFLGAGTGIATYFLVSGAHWRALPILFWVLMFLWQMIPIMLASFQQQFDLGILLRFPVRFGSYYLLYLVFGLLDISTVLGGIACLGIFVGVAVAEPSLLLWTTLALVVFAAFNILLVRAIFAWIERWLAQRKTREILGAVFMIGLLSLQILNPALYQKNHSGHRGHMDQAEQLAAAKARYAPMLKPVMAVEKWLPPGLAAQALQQVVGGQAGAGVASLGFLGIYGLLAGGVLGLRLRSVYRGENLGVAPSRIKAGVSRPKTTPASPGVVALATGAPVMAGSGPVAAIMEKDVRSLLRTLPLLYAIGAPLLLVLVFSTIFVRNGGMQVPVFPLALPICMVYAQLGFTQIFYNNLGTEGAGIQLYFLSPTPMRTVLLAKNLLHAMLFAVVALVAGVLAALRLGVPEPTIVVATAAWLIFALPCNLAAGNLFSLKMPYRVNPGRITRQRGSQVNALLSLLVQLGFLAIGAAVFSLSWFLGRMWLAAPIFLLLAVGAVVVWYQVLGTANDVATERRTELITALMKES
jgi:ABC-2 type transport system permease protein